MERQEREGERAEGAFVNEDVNEEEREERERTEKGE